MGQIVKRKRRGRPSNLDRPHRTSQLPPPDRRSTRTRRHVTYNFDIDDYLHDHQFHHDREKKNLSLLLSQHDSSSNRRVTHAPSSSSSEDDYDDDYFKHSKKRRLNGQDNDFEEITCRKLKEDDDEEEEEAGGSDSNCGMESDVPKGVPMPDKRTLELILDKLQKKDTYWVYAHPVDPDELPDYHDVIKHPMDFGTVRKKLAKGLYLTLKEFERDVFLICKNAMQYNAPDTIYYEQASSIQEQAKLKFQRLRANFDRSEIELKADNKRTPSFSLPTKQSKKSVDRTAPDPEPAGSETFSGATIRTGMSPNGSSDQNPVRPNSSEIQVAENSSLCGDDDLDKDQELSPGKGFRSKLERTTSIHDENRRASYNMSFEPVTDSDSVLSTFEGESKQFIPVGLHADLSYARSLARFAATLGPIAWKIASHTIEQALPEGVKFGPGWVGEYEPLPTTILMPKNRTLKEPNFHAHARITSDVTDNKRTSQSHKIHVDVKEANDSFNPGIPVKQESLKETRKDPSPRPPFYSGSNFVRQNSQSKYATRPDNTARPRVELNHPPPIHVSSPADFVAKRPISIPSKPVLRNGNLASLASFKHPNSNNDGFAPARPSKPVGLDCNKMVLMENNMNHRQDPQGLDNPAQMMKMIAEKTQHQLNNSKGFGLGSKQDDSNNAASTAAQAWMSLGGATTASGGFVRQQSLEYTNPHKQQISVDSLYNSARHEPQVTCFHGEFNTYQQPVRMVNNGQLQNRHVGFPQMVNTTANLSRFQVQSGWRGVPPQMQQPSRPKQQEYRPPDLNIGYQSIGSPVRQSTGMLVDSQQPDLALQL